MVGVSGFFVKDAKCVLGTYLSVSLSSFIHFFQTHISTLSHYPNHVSISSLGPFLSPASFHALLLPCIVFFYHILDMYSNASLVCPMPLPSVFFLFLPPHFIPLLLPFFVPWLFRPLHTLSIFIIWSYLSEVLKHKYYHSVTCPLMSTLSLFLIHLLLYFNPGHSYIYSLHFCLPRNSPSLFFTLPSHLPIHSFTHSCPYSFSLFLPACSLLSFCFHSLTH